MFRIPDYVAKNRLDAGSQPNGHVDDSIGRNVTRLGVAFGTAGDRIAVRQSRALRQAQGRLETAPQQTRPLSADERRLKAHAEKHQAEAAGFQTERIYRNLQRNLDMAETDARTEAGPSGEGFAAFYERRLGLEADKAFAAASADILPDSLPPDLLAGVKARAETDRERRLARAAAEEVQTRRDWTRAELGQMQGELLADLAKEPERFGEILDQGMELVLRNTLPDTEKAELLDAWQNQVERALAGRLAETLAMDQAPFPTRNTRSGRAAHGHNRAGSCG